jgi:hypothetical protein
MGADVTFDLSMTNLRPNPVSTQDAEIPSVFWILKSPCFEIPRDSQLLIVWGDVFKARARSDCPRMPRASLAAS